MSKPLIFAIALLSLAALICYGDIRLKQSSILAQNNNANAAIALLDYPKVIEESETLKRRNEELAKDAQKELDEVEQRQVSAQQELTSEIRNLEVGSKNYKTKYKELFDLAAKHFDERAALENKYRKLRDLGLRMEINRIQGIIEDYNANADGSKKYQVILNVPFLGQKATNWDDVRRQVVTMPVVHYASESLDITEEILSLVNAEEEED